MSSKIEDMDILLVVNVYLFDLPPVDIALVHRSKDTLDKIVFLDELGCAETSGSQLLKKRSISLSKRAHNKAMDSDI